MGMSNSECIRAIQSLSRRIQGVDPRKWMRECIEESNGNGDTFKQCLIKKMETKPHLTNPEVYADELLMLIKGKCKINE
jgi:hypothetical protein